jgi:hypothetical protein
MLASIHRGDDIGVDRTVEGDDAAKGGCRVGLEGFFVGREEADIDRHAAGIGVLDDDAGRRVEGLDTFPGGVGIGDVVVGEFLALQLPVVGDRTRGWCGIAIEGCLLVRILAVTQRLDAIEGKLQVFGERPGWLASSSEVSQLAIAAS